MIAVGTANGAWPADHVARWAIDRLLPYARNARTHTDAQVAQLAEAIKQWGWTNPVLVDPGGEIIAGHGRVMAAKSLGLVDVPVMVARGWSDEQKRAYAIADNKLALNAGWDEHLLSAELIAVGDLRQFVGFSVDELRAFSIGVPVVDEFPELPSGEQGDMRTLTLTLHKDQLETVAEAMRTARALGPFDESANQNRNGNAAARVCELFLEWHQQKTSASRQSNEATLSA